MCAGGQGRCGQKVIREKYAAEDVSSELNKSVDESRYGTGGRYLQQIIISGCSWVVFKSSHFYTEFGKLILNYYIFTHMSTA